MDLAVITMVTLSGMFLGAVLGEVYKQGPLGAVAGSTLPPLIAWSFYGGVMWGVISIAIVVFGGMSALKIKLSHDARMRKLELDMELVRDTEQPRSR